MAPYTAAANRSRTSPAGKVHVLGIEHVGGEKVFVLKFLQARNPEWQGRVFFAEYDAKAIWMDELRPAFGEEKFFFEAEIEAMEEASLLGSGSSGQLFQRPDAPPLLDEGLAEMELQKIANVRALHYIVASCAPLRRAC